MNRSITTAFIFIFFPPKKLLLFSKYGRIENNEQLQQYKIDFNAEFPEYRRLYDFIENVSRQFEELKVLVQAKEEESDEWQVSVDGGVYAH